MELSPTPQVMVQLPEPPLHWAEQLGGVEWPKGSGNKAARVWGHKLTKLVVLRSVSTIKGRGMWYHLSVSRTDRLPSWEELSKVKNEFFGVEAEAYQVLAAFSDHVNVHPNCLHLWMPAEGANRRVANLQEITWEKGA